MIPVNIVAIVIGVLAAYQASSFADPSIPGIQTIPSSIENSLGTTTPSFNGITSSQSQTGSQSIMNVVVTVTTSNGKSNQAIISQSDYNQLITQIPAPAISGVTYINAPTTSSLSNVLQFYQENAPNTATIALCGRSVQELAYDKTDMSTGGDIVKVMSPLPYESLKAHYSNGTIALSLVNPNTAGCMTGLVPNQQQLYLTINGDWNGTFALNTIQNSYITINCYAAWQENVDYDQFGNVLSNYNPPINHLAYCQSQ